ncbi:MAG TPA: hypothetical protein VOB72_27100 [Candidatus Dormibacteraeota bacterium]|nr:hypothetical protein [Candidatus Dormibacteraeota bacterium]
MVARLRPYALHLYLLAYAPAMLAADGVLRDLGPQLALGVVTFAVLWLCTRYVSREEARQVWVCVAIATGFEVFGSLIWGVYRYRLGNVPLYVPPGHGMVYLFGLTAGRLPVFRRHGRRAAYVVLAACVAYAALGVTLLPAVTGRIDVQGALCLPVLAACILFTRRYALFAAIFIAVLDLELAGTWARDWYWLPVAPWSAIPSGNPPSAIAGGYCIIDGTVLLAIAAAGRLRRRLRPATEPAVTEAA